MEIKGGLYVDFEPAEVSKIIKAHVENDLGMSVKSVGWVGDNSIFTVNLNAEVKPAKQSFDLEPLPKPNFAIFTPIPDTDAFGMLGANTAEIRYNDGSTKTIEAEPEIVPAATPPQQENSQLEESSPDTPEKQEEGLRSDSGKKSLDVDSIQRELYRRMPEENKTIWEKKHEASLNGKVKAEEKPKSLKTFLSKGNISTQILTALQNQTDWINGRDLAYALDVKGSYKMINRVQAELARLFKDGKAKRRKGKLNVFEYKALEPHEIPEAAPVGRPADPDSLSRKVFDLLKDSGKALTSAEIAEELDEADGRTLSKILSQFYGRDQLARHLPEGSKAFVYSYEPMPVKPTLSPNAQTVLDTLKEFGCLTAYKNICEAVDLPEIEVTKAIKELKVAKLITSPKIMNYQVVS